MMSNNMERFACQLMGATVSLVFLILVKCEAQTTALEEIIKWLT